MNKNLEDVFENGPFSPPRNRLVIWYACCCNIRYWLSLWTSEWSVDRKSASATALAAALVDADKTRLTRLPGERVSPNDDDASFLSRSDWLWRVESSARQGRLSWTGNETRCVNEIFGKGGFFFIFRHAIASLAIFSGPTFYYLISYISFGSFADSVNIRHQFDRGKRRHSWNQITITWTFLGGGVASYLVRDWRPWWRNVEAFDESWCPGNGLDRRPATAAAAVVECLITSQKQTGVADFPSLYALIWIQPSRWRTIQLAGIGHIRQSVIAYVDFIMTLVSQQKTILCEMPFCFCCENVWCGYVFLAPVHVRQRVERAFML